MIEPKEPIVFDHTPAWAPVGLQWVIERTEMKFRLQSIDTGEVHGRVHAEHRGRPWELRTLSIPTPATAPEWGRTGDQDPAPEFTYRVEFRGNQHAAEYHRLDQAAVALATMWDAHEEEFNELRLLNRLKRYTPPFPVPSPLVPSQDPKLISEIVYGRAVIRVRATSDETRHDYHVQMEGGQLLYLEHDAAKDLWIALRRGFRGETLEP